MSSEATPIQESQPVTPPLTSPKSPSSPESLHLPTHKLRERSPSPMRDFLIPSPLPTRRNRTCSASARAAEGPVFSGVCKCFSRSKGHGFITPSDGGNDIFVHISDVEGEYVPVEGDEVTYKVCAIPPKHEKIQAVEVNITHLKPGSKHETWAGHVISS
ncbi:calcium-regulated heat-stable protein 1 [Poeciliopsis prolifica]|uniref:calcium-regulated heat-stable protein 1 n=1 Tax=Poeciliopsis prolifica TaxID=188132 RepID=UPI00072D16A2|nr:calcium-regulated heat-stable protein 1 [Poeciliopsis prolifica]